MFFFPGRYNAPINVREQQDALEFFNSFADQMDEHLKSFSCTKAFQVQTIEVGKRK